VVLLPELPLAPPPIPKNENDAPAETLLLEVWLELELEPWVDDWLRAVAPPTLFTNDCPSDSVISIVRVVLVPSLVDTRSPEAMNSQWPSNRVQCGARNTNALPVPGPGAPTAR